MFGIWLFVRLCCMYQNLKKHVYMYLKAGYNYSEVEIARENSLT